MTDIENHQMRMHVVILAGGNGSRLWPQSRKIRPKQFLNLYSNKSMLQETINRVNGKFPINYSVICNKDHRFFVESQVRSLNIKAKVIVEPEGRNTAPAIALASFLSNENEVLLVLSADHFIKEADIFNKIIQESFQNALEGNIITFGIKPVNANTGYGYIQGGTKVGNGYQIREFKEKPTQDVAVSYVESQDFYWNSGIFLFHAKTYLDELKKYRPDIYKASKDSIDSCVKVDNLILIDEKKFLKCPSESIDYAVLEKTDKALVVPLDVSWSDMGSWNALWEISEKDPYGNVLKGDVIAKDTSNSYILSDDRLICTIGINDLVVVSNHDALLISSKEKVDEVKNIVEDLKVLKLSQAESHREIHRPWGKFDSIDNGNGFQVKRLTVYPGQKLSVQMHYHRSEHWVVVSGIARVHYGSEVKDLIVNEYTYHDKEVIHALENPIDEDLVLIEVQVGSYLGEDDIVRFEDVYGRE